MNIANELNKKQPEFLKKMTKLPEQPVEPRQENSKLSL